MNKSDKKSINHRFNVWLNQARFDLQACKISLDNKIYDWACYQATQSVEKALKAVVVHSGFQAPRTHKLGVLVGLANRSNESFIKIKLDFRKVEAYTFISRYPFIIPGNNITPRQYILEKDAITCFNLANDMISKIDSFLSDRPSNLNSAVLMKDFYFSKEQIDNRIDLLIQKLKFCSKIKVNKIIMFGSFARNVPHPITSTLDLLIVGESNLDFIERIRYVRNLTKGAEPIIEPLIYSKNELDYLINDEGEGFLESALSEGKVLFEIQ